MREIKFRAWDIKRKKWITDFLISPQGTVRCSGSGGGLLYGGVHETIVEIVQYIGFTDKNGKGIFWGDILLVNNKNYDPENDLYYEGRVLVEKTEQLGFSLKPLDPVDEWSFDSTSMWHVGEGDTTEIIGNKYENQELMK